MRETLYNVRTNKYEKEHAYGGEGHHRTNTSDQSRVDSEQHLRSIFNLFSHSLRTTHDSTNLGIGPGFEYVTR
jgi:hypothetical protein